VKDGVDSRQNLQIHESTGDVAMRNLFLRRKGEDYVGAPSAYHAFEQAVSKIASVKWAGEGWPLYLANEPMRLTVKRVMPDAHWVIDEDSRFVLPVDHDYKVGYMASDLHGKSSFGIGNPHGFVNLLNDTGYDAVFLKYIEVHGTNDCPHIFTEQLKAKPFFLPWSVDPEKFYPREKTLDAMFIGAHGRRYPIRNVLWGGLPSVCEEHRFTYDMRSNPPGKTFERHIPALKKMGYFVGDKYHEALGSTRILLFGCSEFLYPLQKYFEGMASGALVMANEPANAEELHFEDGVNYVDISVYNWKKKLIYYAKHREEAEEIAARGRETILKHHTHDIRARDFIEMIS